MNDVQKALLRDLNQNPQFAALMQEFATHIQRPKWKKGCTESEWAYETGFGDGIDFVLKRMGYDNGR